MGNTPTQADTEKTDDLIQKHLISMNQAGYNGVDGLNERACQLNEIRYLQVETTRFIVVHKLFLRKESPEAMKIIEGNMRFINEKISNSTHPYFLLSSPKYAEELPVLMRQHLCQTLDEKLLGGVKMGWEEKINLSLQILICGTLLHADLK